MPNSLNNQDPERQQAGITSSLATPAESRAVVDAGSKQSEIVPEHDSGPVGVVERLLPARARAAFARRSGIGEVEAANALYDVLTRQRAQRNRITACLVAGFLTAGTICLSALANMVLANTEASIAAMVIGAIAVLAGIARVNSESALDRAAFDAVTAISDPRAVGVLLDLRPHTHDDRRQRLDIALTRILPTVSVETAAALSGDHRNRLLSLLGGLSPQLQTDLCLAAIDSLCAVGDRRSLAPLYAVASGEAASKLEKLVRTAAQKALYSLHGRIDFGSPYSIGRLLKNLCPSGDLNDYMSADSLYALIALLPCLTAQNYNSVLVPGDRKRLHAVLAAAAVRTLYYDQARLYREIVLAVEEARDTDAIAALRQVSLMGAPTDETRQLRSAAVQALATLRQHAERERVSGALLRAAAAPEATPEELLRAAMPGTSFIEPGELLRATNEVAPRVVDPAQPAAEPGHGAFAAATPTSEALARTLEAMRRSREEQA